MTEAVHESLGKRQREEKGLPGGVLKLVYVSAFMPAMGKSLVSSMGNTFPSFTTIKVSHFYSKPNEHHPYRRRKNNKLTPAQKGNRPTHYSRPSLPLLQRRLSLNTTILHLTPRNTSSHRPTNTNYLYGLRAPSRHLPLLQRRSSFPLRMAAENGRE